MSTIAVMIAKKLTGKDKKKPPQKVKKPARKTPKATGKTPAGKTPSKRKKK